MLRSFNPHGDKINAIQVTGNTFLWTASDDGSVLQTYMQLNTTEREFKSRPKDTLIGLIQLVVSFCQLISYPFLSYSSFISIVMGFFTGGKGSAGIFSSDTAVTIFYHFKLVGTILALIILFFILYKQYVPIYRHDIEMIELYGNLHGPDQSSRRSKSKLKNNKSGKSYYNTSTLSIGGGGGGASSSKNIKNINTATPTTNTVKKSLKIVNEDNKKMLSKSGTTSTFTVNESTTDLRVKPPPEPSPKIIIKPPVDNNKDNNKDNGNITPTSPSNPVPRSPGNPGSRTPATPGAKSPAMLKSKLRSANPSKRKSKRGSAESFTSLADLDDDDINNELDGMTPHDKVEEKVDDGTVTPKQFSRMKILKKLLWCIYLFIFIF